MSCLPSSAAPRADVDAPGIQNESGFDRRRAATGTGGTVNPQNGKGAKYFAPAERAYDAVLFYEEIHIIFGRALAGQLFQASTIQANTVAFSGQLRRLIGLGDSSRLCHKSSQILRFIHKKRHFTQHPTTTRKRSLTLCLLHEVP